MIDGSSILEENVIYVGEFKICCPLFFESMDDFDMENIFLLQLQMLTVGTKKVCQICLCAL